MSVEPNKLKVEEQQSRQNQKICYPIVFQDDYDLRVGIWAKLHPFDSKKWGRVAQFIKSSFNGNISFIEPKEPISDDELRLVHTEQFLKDLNSRKTLVKTSEVVLLFFFPLSWSKKNVLEPLRFQTKGTIIAILLAFEYNISAINIGGGFHHCSAEKSGGFCFFADITLAIRKIWYKCVQDNKPKPSIMIVDCDAHQGNGYQHDVLKMSSEERKLVYILDLFNPRIYPWDDLAKSAIDREVHLKTRIGDDDYLKLLDYHLKATLDVDKFRPQLIIYNAGTDILQGDALGRLNITPMGVMKRDEMLFRFAQTNQISIVMLLSGGYQLNNAQVIADSILNLINQKLILPNNKLLQ